MIDPSQFEALLVNEIGFREVRHCVGMRGEWIVNR